MEVVGQGSGVESTIPVVIVEHLIPLVAEPAVKPGGLEEPRSD